MNNCSIQICEVRKTNILSKLLVLYFTGLEFERSIDCIHMLEEQKLERNRDTCKPEKQYEGHLKCYAFGIQGK